MVRTVNKAFNTFLKNNVNLDETEYSNARKSRNWLIEQIKKFPQNYEDFPKLYPLKIKNFGSFARKTKIRPLDDIDLLICISAEGATYRNNSTDDIIIYNRKNNSQLGKLLNGNEINSRKVIEKFKSCVSDIEQYKASSIIRDHEALTLDLKSYDWKFDIVPCFFTAPEFDGRHYYLIPNGQGRWKKTNPLIDQDIVTTLNQKKDGKLLDLIRLTKYWNKHQKVKQINSYILENIILNYYKNRSNFQMKDIKYEFNDLMNHLQTINSSIPDPQNIHGNYYMNNDELLSIKRRAIIDYKISYEALKLEEEDKIEEAIKKWKEIFGEYFPDYS